jgi:hypothetical protein
MPEGHRQFAIYNHTVNHVVKGILRSPAHGLVSKNLLVMSVTGRRTGKKRTFPVAYSEDGPKHLRIHIDWPEKKVWWRNLKQPSPVSVRLRGKELTGIGHAQGDPKTDLWVDVQLD